MIRSLLFVIILCSFHQPKALAKAYYGSIKWVKQGEFVMDLIQDRRGVSVNRLGKTQKQDHLTVDMINCSYFWVTSGRYWPVGLVRTSGGDKTSMLLPSRGYAYFNDRRFHLSWKMPPKESRVAFQGHIIIMDGRRTKRNGGFSSYHWSRNCPRSIVAIRRDKYGVEYVGIIRAYGNLHEITEALIKDQRVIAAVNNDGGSSTNRSKRVVNILIIRSIDKRVIKLKQDLGLVCKTPQHKA